MLKRTAAVLAFAASAACAEPQLAAPPKVDAAAPAFEGRATTGETISLADFAGEKVILEWTNHECPFVKKHYETGNMQSTQRAARESGAKWITIISSAPGKQGYLQPAAADALTSERDAAPDYVVIDAAGEIGRAYAAKTTPQMAVIDEAGILRYEGAIDDKPSADHATVEGATNYVLAALARLQAGEDVAVKQTRPYGCSVKYGS
ncbi:MAG: redoxin family protein [Amphiplicatus sp.]